MGDLFKGGAAAETSFLASAFLACSITKAVTGKATEASMAMITITIRSSMSVNADSLRFVVFEKSFVLMVMIGI